MSHELARIRRAYFFAYYRRLAALAAAEATRRWLAWLGASFFVAVLTFCLLLVGGGDGLSSAAWGLLAFAASWVAIAAWFVLVIPPRIERETQLKEETLRVLSQRRNVANELRNHMVQCRIAAQRARDAEIQANSNGATVAPPHAETFHQQALAAARHAEERLEWLGTQTGHPSYQSQIIEISAAVNTRKCATVEEAIGQLEGLGDAIERQLSSAAFW